MNGDPAHWTIDKKLPVGFFIGLALQTAVFAFWIGGLSEKVENNTTAIRDKQSDTSRIAVMESKVDDLSASIARLTNTIDRLLQERRQR